MTGRFRLPTLGTVLNEKYRLERLLGEGTFAWVFLARHATIDSLRYAVKILKPAHCKNEDTLRRFKREAVTIAALQGLHTVRVFDFGVSQYGLPYMVMEYVQGPSLRELLKRDGRLTPNQVARIAIGVLRGLEEAHGLGIVHRDLKPSNIVVTRVREETHAIVKVLDFGIAKVLQGDQITGAEETADGMLFCSPRYASPEILLGRPSLQSDLYSLGHIMAELLAGEAPYGGEATILVASQHLHPDPVPLGPAVTDTELHAVIRRACAKPLEERYQSASRMLADVRDAYGRMTGTGLDENDPDIDIGEMWTPDISGPVSLQGAALDPALARALDASSTQPVGNTGPLDAFDPSIHEERTVVARPPSSSDLHDELVSAPWKSPTTGGGSRPLLVPDVGADRTARGPLPWILGGAVLLLGAVLGYVLLSGRDTPPAGAVAAPASAAATAASTAGAAPNTAPPAPVADPRTAIQRAAAAVERSSATRPENRLTLRASVPDARLVLPDDRSVALPLNRVFVPTTRPLAVRIVADGYEPFEQAFESTGEIDYLATLQRPAAAAAGRPRPAPRRSGSSQPAAAAEPAPAPAPAPAEPSQTPRGTGIRNPFNK